MNKRQAKKAYKKKYGHNPPKTWQQSFNINWRSLGEAVGRVAETIGRMLGQVVEIAKDFTEKIQTMSEEEFIAFMEDERLDQQQRALLLTIRAKRKGAYNHDSSN